MAKIPRINPGDKPSAVPRAGPSGQNGVAPLIDSLGGVVDVGYRIAADEATIKSEAGRQSSETARVAYQKQLRDALAAKQAIANEVQAGRLAGDFEEDLVLVMDTLKKQYRENPEKIPELLLDRARQLADRQIQSAPNMAVGLELAQRTTSRIDTAMREAHHYAQAGLTQRIRVDLDKNINRFTFLAGQKPSSAALAAHLAGAEAQLGPSFAAVFGAEAGKQMVALKTQATQEWAFKYSHDNPVPFMAELKTAPEGNPLVEHLNSDQRKSAFTDAEASYDGLQKTRDQQAIVEGLSSNRRIVELFTSGASDFVETAYAQKVMLDSQAQAVKAGLQADETALKNAGVNLQGRTPGEVLGMIDSRRQLIDALIRAKRKQTPYDTPDDPTAVEGLLIAQDKALRANKGKDLLEIAKQQTRLAVALGNKTISGATAQTMFKDLVGAMDVASAKEEDVWGPNTLRWFHGPRAAGSVELNRQFSGAFSKLEKPVQMRVRLAYMSQFNAAQSTGGNVTVQAARAMAIRALSLETGERLPGVD